MILPAVQSLIDELNNLRKNFLPGGTVWDDCSPEYIYQLKGWLSALEILGFHVSDEYSPGVDEDIQETIAAIKGALGE